MNKTKPYTFDRVVRLLIGITILTFSFLLIKRLSGVLLPFLIAWLIAYLLHPLVNVFQYRLKLKNRILSICCTLLAMVGLMTGIVFLLTPLISSEVEKLINIMNMYTQGMTMGTIVPEAWQNEIRNFLTQFDIYSFFKEDGFMSIFQKAAPQVWNLLNGSLSIIVGLTMIVIVFLYLVFILKDYEVVTKGMFSIIPQKYRNITSEVIRDLERGMNRYFRGQTIVAITVGVLFSIGFSIEGLPLAIIFGLFMGMLNMVPYLKVVGIIPAMLLALLQSTETGQSFLSIMMWLVGIFVVIQLIEDLILVPNIMGRYTGLNPAVILLSLSVWGSLMGLVGLIIALPMTTLVISYYKRFVLKEVESAPTTPVPESKGKQRKETTKKRFDDN